MNKRIAKLAKTLSSDFNDNLQVIFDNLLPFMTQNRDYFSQFGPEDTIKLVYYIYSLNKTGNLDLGEKILSELYISQFFDYSKSNPHMEQCDECSGDGNKECNYCDGNGQVRCGDCDDGNVECSVCDAEGEVECGECSGEGTVDGEECGECSGSGLVKCTECEGDGELTCSTCGGDGYENCYECQGSGSETCDSCEGDGQVETTEYDYDIEEWLIFDSELISYLEKESKDYSPLGEILEFAKRPTVLLISKRMEHGEFDESVEQDQKYCFKISPLSSEKLYFQNNGRARNPLSVGNYILGITTWDEPDTVLRD